MSATFIFTILVVGLSGVVAQVLLVRELLVSFYGNELTIGIVLANWLVSEALGVYLIGRFIDKVKNKIHVFLLLQIVFSFTLPFALYFSRTCKAALGIPFGETIGLYLIFISSFCIILPVGFCHGALFSTWCAITTAKKNSEESGIGKVYFWEMLGTIAGGIAMTYFFIPRLASFQTAFVIAGVNLCLCLAFSQDAVSRKINVITVACLGVVLFSLCGGGADTLHRSSIAKQWGGRNVLAYRNSIYGNVTVSKQKEQYTFFYNGMPVITTPVPDITFVEEFGNLPLLAHRAPKDILVIGAGAGGLINEIRKHPVRHIDYLEIDPVIIDEVRKHPTALTKDELQDARVRVVNQDGRFFLRANAQRYDIIEVGLSNQADLSTNRLFTREFFSLAKSRLRDEGIFTVWLPSSLTYLSPELRDVNASVLNSLKDVFAFVRIIPGDYVIALASNSEAVMRVSPEVFSQRITQRALVTKILVPRYLEYRLDEKWAQWFRQSLSGATTQLNQDAHPVAVYETLLLWNKKFSPAFYWFLTLFKNLRWLHVLIFILIVTGALAFAAARKKDMVLPISYSILTSGFFGMLANLLLVFSYQVYFGYLYYVIGLLLSVFMAGAAAGSLLMARQLKKIRNRIDMLLACETVIIVFSFLLAMVITDLPGSPRAAQFIFIALFFVTGMLMGFEFPLASAMCLGDKRGTGTVSGLLYSADLVGGWLAGVLGGVVLVPVMGIFGACIVMILIKLSSFFLVYFFRKNSLQNP